MDENRSLLLVVEEAEPTQTTLTRLLAEEGWRVRSARSAAEGLALLGVGPRCVVVDLGLPEGEALVRRVREEHPRTRLVVLASPGEEAVLPLPPRSVVRKPVEVNQFLRACAGGDKLYVGRV
jgi:DNA-binding response OmpR family regulator